MSPALESDRNFIHSFSSPVQPEASLERPESPQTASKQFKRESIITNELDSRLKYIPSRKGALKHAAFDQGVFEGGNPVKAADAEPVNYRQSPERSTPHACSPHAISPQTSPYFPESTNTPAPAEMSAGVQISSVPRKRKVPGGGFKPINTLDRSPYGSTVSRAPSGSQGIFPNGKPKQSATGDAVLVSVATRLHPTHSLKRQKLDRCEVDAEEVNDEDDPYFFKDRNRAGASSVLPTRAHSRPKYLAPVLSPPHADDLEIVDEVSNPTAEYHRPRRQSMSPRPKTRGKDSTKADKPLIANSVIAKPTWHKTGPRTKQMATSKNVTAFSSIAAVTTPVQPYFGGTPNAVPTRPRARERMQDSVATANSFDGQRPRQPGMRSSRPSGSDDELAGPATITQSTKPGVSTRIRSPTQLHRLLAGATVHDGAPEGQPKILNRKRVSQVLPDHVSDSEPDDMRATERTNKSSIHESINPSKTGSVSASSPQPLLAPEPKRSDASSGKYRGPNHESSNDEGFLEVPVSSQRPLENRRVSHQNIDSQPDSLHESLEVVGTSFPTPSKVSRGRDDHNQSQAQHQGQSQLVRDETARESSPPTRQPTKNDQRPGVGDVYANILATLSRTRDVQSKVGLASDDAPATDVQDRSQARTSGRLRRSSRRSDVEATQHVDLVEKPDESTEVTERSADCWWNKNKDKPWKRALIWPPESRKQVQVNFSDLERLEPGEFLNDALVSFVLLHTEIEFPQRADEVYFFNTFFYESFTKVVGQPSVKHARVAKWTKKVDIFKFPYIIVPVCRQLHWHLFIICNAGKLLTSKEARDAKMPQSGVFEKSGHRSSMLPSSQPSRVGSSPPNQAQIDFDTLEDGNVVTDMSKMSIEGNESNGLVDLSAPDLLPSSKEEASRSKGSSRLDPSFTTIISLDSMGQSRSSEVANLKQYLIEECRDKKGITGITTQDIKGITAKNIPLQKNFSDCGLYLLYYVQEFMSNPARFVDTVSNRTTAEDEKIAELPFETARVGIRNMLVSMAGKAKAVRLQKAREAQQKQAQNGPAFENETLRKKASTASPPSAAVATRTSNGAEVVAGQLDHTTASKMDELISSL